MSKYEDDRIALHKARAAPYPHPGYRNKAWLPKGWRRCLTGSVQRQANGYRATIKEDVEDVFKLLVRDLNTGYMVHVSGHGNLEDAIARADELMA